MSRRSSILLWGCWLALGTVTAAGGDWTGWRGGDRDGHVAGVDAATWGERLEEVWGVEVGSGYATPLVVGERVFVHARQGDEEVLMCLELETGKVKWKKGYEVFFRPGSGGQSHGRGPKSSPVYADGRLFTMSVTGVLSGWDAESGELRWSEDFKERFGRNQPYWGVSTSPLVAGDVVVAQVGNDETGALVGLDVASGKVRWSNGDEPTSYSSPIAVEIGGVRQVAMWNAKRLVGVDAATGKRLWAYDWAMRRTDQNTATPCFADGRFYLGGENRGMRSVEVTKDGGAWKVEEKWRMNELALDMSSPVLVDGKLFGFSHYRRGKLFCQDAATGEVLWTAGDRIGENVNFHVAGDRVVALVDDGELLVFEASGEGFREVRRYAVPGDRTWTPPVLLADGVLVKGRERLVRLR